MVSPPPGVSSAVQRAAHRLGEAAGQREAQPDAGGVVGVAEPLERHEHPVPVLLGDAGPAVDHAQLDPVAERARGQQRRLARRRVAQRVLGQVHDDPLEDGRVGEDLGQRVRDVDQEPRGRRVQVVQRAGHDLVQPDRAREHGQRAGLQPAHVQQVADQVGEPVQRLVRGGEQLVAVLGRPVHVRRAQAGDRGLRGGQRGAQVVADRAQQRGPHPVGGRDRLGRLGLGGQPLLLQRDRRVGRRTRRAPGGPRPAAACPAAPASSRRRPAPRRRPRPAG